MKTIHAAALFLLAISGCMLAGCGGSHSVSGKVTLDGAPLEGAEVRLSSKAGSAVHSATTDAKGKFTVMGTESTPVEPGEYVMIVDKVAAEMGAESVVPAPYRDKATSPLTVTIDTSFSALPDQDLKSSP